MRWGKHSMSAQIIEHDATIKSDNGAPCMYLHYAAASFSGLKRANNEDSFLAKAPYFLVADGMGGHTRGDAASQAVVASFSEYANGIWATREQMWQAFEKARRDVENLARHDTRPPGSTLTGVALASENGVPCWHVINMGDSRTYLRRSNMFKQLTVDHSAQRLHPKSHVPRSVITRALGAGIKVKQFPDRWVIPVVDGDTLLICSDGLYTEVDDERINKVLQEKASPAEAVQELIEYAYEAGAHDNVTALVLNVRSLSIPDGAVYVDSTIEDPDAQSLAVYAAYEKNFGEDTFGEGNLGNENLSDDTLSDDTLGDDTADDVSAYMDASMSELPEEKK